MLNTLLETPGVRVGIISDNHEICTRWLARETPELFKSHTIILSQQVGGLKPEPVMYELALESIGLPADACMFIDDREPNIIGALGYGMKGVVHKHWAITGPLVEDFVAGTAGL
jgi:putative hydrolase of the HAD superfamily